MARVARWSIALVAVLVTVLVTAATGAVLTGVFASGLGAGPAMPPLALSGKPVVKQVAVGDEHVRIVVVPHRPGPNLVWVEADGYRVGPAAGELVPAERRPGAPGAWATVELPAGPSTLWVEQGDRRAALVVDAVASVPVLAAITTAAGPECVSAVVGAVMAGAAPPAACPNQALAAEDRTALRLMLRSIAERGVPGIRLVGGDSPRADAAEAVVRQQAARLGLPLDGPRHPLDARVVVADWARAEQALITQTRDYAGSGVYLAPWLGNGTLLGYSSGAVVVLNYDTTEGAAAEYIAALDRFAARDLASPAGFAAWLAASDRPQPVGPTRLYAALAGFSMMGVEGDRHAMSGVHSSSAGHGMSGGTGGWIPKGRLTAVSRPLGTS